MNPLQNKFSTYYIRFIKHNYIIINHYAILIDDATLGCVIIEKYI